MIDLLGCFYRCGFCWVFPRRTVVDQSPLTSLQKNCGSLYIYKCRLKYALKMEMQNLQLLVYKRLLGKKNKIVVTLEQNNS